MKQHLNFITRYDENVLLPCKFDRLNKIFYSLLPVSSVYLSMPATATESVILPRQTIIICKRLRTALVYNQLFGIPRVQLRIVLNLGQGK